MARAVARAKALAQSVIYWPLPALHGSSYGLLGIQYHRSYSAPPLQIYFRSTSKK